MRKLFYFIMLGALLWGCAKKPIKIGVVVPLSQKLSCYGEMCLKGVKMAVKIINERGGIKGSQVEILVEDNKGKEEASQSAVKKLDEAGVLAIIGPLTTKNTMWIGKYADDVGLPIITPTATGIEVTKDREWVWRISFTDPMQGIMLAKFAREELKVNSVCIFLDPQDPYSRGLSESFGNEFKRLGGKVLFEAIFKTGDTLFNTQLKVIKKQNPECIFIPAFCQEAGLISRQARDMGFKQPFIGGDGWDSPHVPEIIGDRAGVNYYSTHFFYNYGGEEVQGFLHKFRGEYKEEPQTFSALGYDALMVIQECLKLSGKVTRDEFKNNIMKTKFLGVTGNIDFTQGKDPRRSLMILKFEPGKPIEMVSRI